MADIEDISATLASTIVDIINLAGPAPVPLTVAPGWPTANDMNAVVKTGAAHISVFPQPGVNSNATRWEWLWQVSSAPVQTLTAAVATGAITFGGTAILPLNIAVTAASKVYTYSATSGDTSALIATALAALINVDIAATAAGPVITIPSGPVDLKVTLGGQGTLLRENVREKQGFQITVWANSQANRLAISKSFEAALYGLNFITLPDGTAGMLSHMRSLVSDNSESEGLYRRDIICSVEYGITQTAPAWTVVTAPLTTIPVPGPPPITSFPSIN